MCANIASAWRSISSVSASTYHEPPSGSATFATRVSFAITCWVRSAMRAAFSVGQRERLVHRVRVQALRAAEHAGQRLDRGAHDVDLGLLRGERHARGLRVEPQLQRALGARAVAVAHPARPDAARGAVLGDLLEEVDVRVEEERQPRRERVDVEAGLQPELDVREPVGERERELLRGGRARFADVVAGDRDRVPLRHLARCRTRIVSRDEPHRRARREDELLLRLVLLEDVVLERAAEPRARRRPVASALATNIAKIDRGRAVDRHRRRDRAEVDAAVEVFDVGERVDRDAALADLAERELVVGVAAHQRREVERGREAVAAGGEELVEPAVRVDRGAEARRTCASSRASSGTSTRTGRAVYGYWPGNSPSSGP